MAPAARMASIVGRPTTGTSKRMSWFGLATLTIADAGPGEPAGPRDHLVGALHRLDRHHGAVLDGNRLPDVETRHGVGHPVAELEVRVRLGARLGAGDRPAAREQRREEGRRVDQLDAVVAQHLRDRRDQRVGVPGAQAQEDGQQQAVGHDAGEDLDVLDLPGHHRVGDAGRPEGLDALPQLAEREPVDRGPRLAGGGVLEFRERLLPHGDDGHLVAEPAGGVEHEQREPAVARDEAEVHRASTPPPCPRRRGGSASAAARRGANCG